MSDERNETTPASIPGAPATRARSINGPPGRGAGGLPRRVRFRARPGRERDQRRPNTGHACFTQAPWVRRSPLRRSVSPRSPSARSRATRCNGRRRAICPKPARPARPRLATDSAQSQRASAALRQVSWASLGETRSVRARARRAGCVDPRMATDGKPDGRHGTRSALRHGPARAGGMRRSLRSRESARSPWG